MRMPRCHYISPSLSSSSRLFVILKPIVKKFLTYDDLKLLACALVLSHIDYCNVLYYHISSHNIRMLQSVQNSAARLVSGVNRFDQIDNDNLFQKLHWLKVNERIEYKILTIVHKCLYGNAPSDLSSLLLPSQSDRTKMLKGRLAREMQKFT